MRLVRLKVIPGKSDQIIELYRTRVLPKLSEAPGCLFASLTESVKQPDECVSLTLWDSQHSIKAYEQHGPFVALLRESEPYLAESGEWRVQLGDDMTLAYGPAKEPPKVSAYRFEASMDEAALGRVGSSAEYLRLLRLTVTPDRIEDVRNQYVEEVIPALQEVKGCLFACLLENLDSENQLASMTLWESRRDAEDYERSEVFKALLERARQTVGAQAWDLMLETQPPGQGDEKSAPTQTYDIVAGRDLRH